MGSRATSLCSFQDHVVQTFVFSSRSSCAKTCHPHPTPLLHAQDLLIANDSTVSFLPPSLADNATFFTLPFSNNPPSSLNWNDSHHTKRMSPSKVLSASSIICLPLRSTRTPSNLILTMLFLPLFILLLPWMTPWTFCTTKDFTITYFPSHQITSLLDESSAPYTAP